MIATAKVGPELFFAIVCPVGTPNKDVIDQLAGEMSKHDYDFVHVKLSHLLRDEAIGAGREVPVDEAERIRFLIGEGDDRCAAKAAPEAVALLAVQEIRRRRQEHHAAQTGSHPADETLAEKPVPRRAYLLDSLKRVAEVSVLREIYGDRLILLGLRAPEAARKTELQTKIEANRSSVSGKELDALVDELMSLDDKEPGEYGQDVQKTLPLADIFINIQDSPADGIPRLVSLLFGDPKYCAPKPAEYGMRVAMLSSTRSPELGRKVGAALVKDDYTVIAQGANIDHAAKGSPAYDQGQRDIRKLVLDTLTQLKDHLDEETGTQLLADGEALARTLLQGPLKEGGIADLTEFQRPVHAEMTALLSALANNGSVTDATFYVTAEPCHNCTKHILALKIPVRYLSPYPKGRAGDMYGQAVADTFLPFEGIAPRRYHALFDVEEDRKTTVGIRNPWDAAERRAAQPRLDPFVEAGLAEREAAALAQPEAAADATASAGAPERDTPGGETS